MDGHGSMSPGAPFCLFHFSCCSFHLQIVLFPRLQLFSFKPFMDLVLLTNLLTPENQKPPR
jgi:hypothetical protein